ncbi:MltA domain-containing protein [Desulfovibrio sp. TomC]|uniref:MltA domain-containing protein n=1 Tax=Desulfovibrio sp. TomC TaxID=1562888 RepID=UPI000573CA51|nr:MltA domain-containing protein [Desulfovibrio sp. TomC]KHK03647.1 Membrane-bound lytic murein transglycosylase A precursor [Desulfovibrio sp. TomC]
MMRPAKRHFRALALATCLATCLLTGCAGLEDAPRPAAAQQTTAAQTPAATSQVRAPVAPPITTPWNSRISPASQQITSFAALAPAVDRSIAYAARKPANAVAVDQPGARLTWGQLHQSLTTFRRILPELDRDPTVLAKYFTWAPLATDTLLTGYYEPTIEVSRTRQGQYIWPIYRNPGASGKQHSREAIDYKGVLAGRNLELGFAKDPIAVFFLHVQGSGKLRYIEDGSTIYALFDGHNAHRYVGVGRVMVERGCFPEEEMSMQRIRRFLEENPSQVREYLTKNPSYIFFKASQTPPVGAMGVPVTPHASVAVDPGFVPYGTLLAVDGDLPGYPPGTGPGVERFTGFVMAQDTGCMRGNHFDLYLGPGEKAAHQAGLMKGTAKAYVLLPK